MARTGCAFAAVTCLCCPARTHRDRQVLPAYGLQDLPIKTKNPSRGSKPNTMWLPITLGESLGRGHFYLAETRTFLLCVDTHLSPGHAPVGSTRSWRLKTLIYRIIGMRESALLGRKKPVSEKAASGVPAIAIRNYICTFPENVREGDGRSPLPGREPEMVFHPNQLPV